MANEKNQNAKPEVIEYWQSLGRFVHQFSSVEQVLQMLLWHFAGVKDSIGMAIFSGVRIDGSISLMRRIAEVDAEKKILSGQLDDALKQLVAINTIRNDILHYGAHGPPEPYKKISNAAFALTPDRIKETPISPEFLENLARDLSKINGHFTKTLWPNDPQFDAFLPVVNSPWRYKRPQPEKKNPQDVKGVRTQQRQRESPPEKE